MAELCLIYPLVIILDYIVVYDRSSGSWLGQFSEEWRWSILENEVNKDLWQVSMLVDSI